MRKTQRWTALVALLALVLPLSAVALAGEQVRNTERVQVMSTDEAPPAVTPDMDSGNIDAERDRIRDQDRTRTDDRPMDRPTDRPIDDPERERERHQVRDQRCTDEVPDGDCCADRAVDAQTCGADAPADAGIRKLIWRLIFAHEWEKLFGVLHRLGII